MVDPRLVKFVQDNLKQGYTADNIKLSLTKKGFTEADFNEALQSVNQQTISTRPPNEAKKSGMPPYVVVIIVVIALIFVGIIALVVIGSIAYFGVLSPDKFVPERCQLPAGIACTDFQAKADGTTKILLRNGLGFDIVEMTVSLENECTPSNVGLANGESQEFTCMSTGGEVGEDYRQVIFVNYTNVGSKLQHTMEGSLYSTLK